MLFFYLLFIDSKFIYLFIHFFIYLFPHLIDCLLLIGFGAGDNVSVTPKFISPIWELVSERNNCDDIDMKDTNKQKEEGEEGEEVGEKGAGEGEKVKKGEAVTKDKKGKGEVKVNSTHTAQSLPSASYSQSFQGF